MVPELRPRGIGEILDAAVALYRARFGQLVRYAAIVVVPVQVFLTLVLLSAQPDHFSVTLNGNATPQFDTSRAPARPRPFVVLVVGVLTHAFVAAVTTRVVADEYVGLRRAGRPGRPHRRPAVLRGARGRRARRALPSSSACSSASSASFAAQALFSVAIPVVILERRRVFAAMGRSFELTRVALLARARRRARPRACSSALLNVALAAGLNIWSAHGGSPTVARDRARHRQHASRRCSPRRSSPPRSSTLYFDLRIRDEAFDVQMATRASERRDAGRGRPPVDPDAARRGAPHPLGPPVPVRAHARGRSASR